MCTSFEWKFERIRMCQELIEAENWLNSKSNRASLEFFHSYIYKKACIMFIKKTSKLRISKNDLFMNQKGHILQKVGSIAPNDSPHDTGMSSHLPLWELALFLIVSPRLNFLNLGPKAIFFFSPPFCQSGCILCDHVMKAIKEWWFSV